MKKFFCLLVVLASCKGHVRETEASEPDFAKSNDGTMLTLALATKPQPTASDPKPSDDPYFCVLTLNEHNNQATLLTADGGLSKNQLKKTLHYMSFKEDAITQILISVGLVGATAALSAPVFLGLIGVTYAGNVVYRVIRGSQEGESGKAKAISIVGSLPFIGVIPEVIRRGDRFKKLASETEVLKISDKKMGKVIERVTSMKAKYKGTCDYLTKK